MTGDSNKKIPSLYAWLGIVATFVFALFFILATFVPSSQSALNDNISGWGWSPLLSGTLGWYTGSGFGLVSFNDCYCFYSEAQAGYICRVNIDEPCVSDKGLGYAPYGLRVDLQKREIIGWVWSQGAGWICFGASCRNGGGIDYSTDFKGSDWEPTNPNLEVTYTGDQDPAPISGWAKIVGWSGLGDGQMSWISLRGLTTDDGSEYGLRFSTSTLEIRGLGWGGINDPAFINNDGSGMSYVGYGWLCINEEYNGPDLPGFTGRGLCPSTGIQVAVPYIQTVDGDVYSQTNISPDIRAPSGNFNATYLIMAGGNIQNFSSEERDSTFGSGEYIMSNFPYSISLPKASTNFFNVFGYLDIPGISYNGTNKYGAVNFIPSAIGDWSINGDFSWPNTRYIIENGDLTIGSASDPGTTRYTRGNTTFVVNGDLYIVKNIYYSQDPVTKFTDLPSVAYIVRGDVYISPEVTEIAGNFIVLGADAVNCDAPGCGAIYTGASETNTLQVNGIMMAKKFVMQRTYASVLQEPAEQVIYDGRLLINTPPGLQDFAKGLPIWSEVTPR